MSNIVAPAAIRKYLPVEKALGLIVEPRGPTTGIVARVKKLVFKMTPEEVAEFRQRLREINERDPAGGVLSD
jgi:hypothetical protein